MISWVRPLQLPESHTISVNLASTQPDATGHPPPWPDNNQGSGNTSKNTAGQPSPVQRAASSDPSASLNDSTPQPRQVHTIRQAIDKKSPALPSPSAESTDTPATPVNAGSLLAQVGQLSAVRGDVTMNDSSLESGRNNGNGDSTHRYEWARYQTDWRLRIERIGNLNYPEQARQLNIHGSVTLEVTVAADGSLLKCRILRAPAKACWMTVLGASCR
jgi:protein TonB